MRLLLSLILPLILAVVSHGQSSIRVQRNNDGKVVGVRVGGKSSANRLEVSADAIVSIAKMKGVQSASFSFSMIDDEMIKPIAAMKDLVFVDLSFSDVTGKTIEVLATLPNLRLLEMNACDVRDEHLSALEKMPQLVHLRLQRTKVTDRGLKHIGKLKELVMLDLQACEITDAGLKSMGHFPQLQQLYLTKSVRYGRDDRVELTDDCVDYLASLTTLTDLRIGSTKMTADGIARLKTALPKAQISTETDGILYLGVKKPAGPSK